MSIDNPSSSSYDSMLSMHLCSLLLILFMFISFSCYSNYDSILIVFQGFIDQMKFLFIALIFLLIPFLFFFFFNAQRTPTIMVDKEELVAAGYDGSVWGVLLVLIILLFLAFLPLWYEPEMVDFVLLLGGIMADGGDYGDVFC